MMRVAWVVAAGMLLGFLVSCSSFSDEQIRVLQQMVADGVITQAQYDLLTAANYDWIGQVAGHLATLVAGFFGIRYWRGGINSRNGQLPA